MLPVLGVRPDFTTVSVTTPDGRTLTASLDSDEIIEGKVD